MNRVLYWTCPRLTILLEVRAVTVQFRGDQKQEIWTWNRRRCSELVAPATCGYRISLPLTGIA